MNERLNIFANNNRTEKPIDVDCREQFPMNEKNNKLHHIASDNDKEFPVNMNRVTKKSRKRGKEHLHMWTMNDSQSSKKKSPVDW